MSHEATAWAYKQSLPPIPKFILVTLADTHNGRTNQCNPSISWLMEKTSVSRRATYEALRSLESTGQIKTVARYKRSKRLANQYILNVTGLPDALPSEPYDDDEKDDEETTQESSPKPIHKPTHQTPAHPENPLPQNFKPAPRYSDEDVERVYSAYPRRVGKGRAIPEIHQAVVHLATGIDWPALSGPEALVFLKEKAERFARSPAGNAGEYTPHPAKWFHEKRYFDDEKEWQRGSDKENGNFSTNRVSPATQRERESNDAIEAAVAARVGRAPRATHAPIESAKGHPDAPSGYHSDVSGGVGSPGDQIWDAKVRRRTLEGVT